MPDNIEFYSLLRNSIQQERKKDRDTHNQFEQPYPLFLYIIGAHPLMQQSVNILHFSQRPLVGENCDIIKKDQKKQKTRKHNS